MEVLYLVLLIAAAVSFAIAAFAVPRTPPRVNYIGLGLLLWVLVPLLQHLVGANV